MTVKNPRTGIHISYYDKNSDAPPIILLHGLAGNHTRWSPAADLLAGNYRVIGYDLRGHGMSDKGPELECDFDVQVEDLAGLMDELGISRAVVVGHSMGGMIAQRFALKYPERVSKLILVATTACMKPGWFMNAAFKVAAALMCIIPGLLGMIVRKKTSGKPRELFPEKDNPELDFNNSSIARCFQAIARMDYRNPVHTLNVPTLVLSSSKDEMIAPARVKELADSIPDARFKIIDNDSHYLPLEQPAEVADVISEFIGAGQGAAIS